MEALLGHSLTGKHGDVATSSVNAKFKLLYFSAHWCPPCRQFTPRLVMFYNEVNASQKLVEVVFVSYDKTPDQFREYYESMPWLSVPYQDRNKAQMLGSRFGVQGIPALILVNSQGVAVNSECRNDVMNIGPSCLSRWENLLR